MANEGQDLGMVDEVELLDDDDEVTRVSSADATGMRPALGANGEARASAPPPIPDAARAPRRSSGLPPAPPPLGQLQPTVSELPSSHRSGMFRIERPSVPPAPPAGALPRTSSAPPPPTGATEVAELKRTLVELSTQIRELGAQIHRLRLTVRLREDRIRELEIALHGQTERAQSLLVELERTRAERAADDLKRITGIGPGYERALHELGVTTFAQIAAWAPSDIERVATALRTTPKRILRDDWITRARALVDEPAQ
jgi:predicted flap endonuclease-1-like 5' DNA nuclease